MNRKPYVTGLSIGLAIGFIVKTIVHEVYKKVTPEKALQYAKETFKKNGPINSSWIYVRPRRLQLNGLTYNAYRGGISRNIDGKIHQYDFYADVETGTIILSEEITK